MNASPLFPAPTATPAPLPVLPPRPGVTDNHRNAHALAEAGGGWLCAYCSATLVDTCGLELTESRHPDESGELFYKIPAGYHGVAIHHGPNVLACGTCIGRKSAEKSLATRRAQKAAA